jgi:DNA repair exonuclease SbcCD ATPase subunit
MNLNELDNNITKLNEKIFSDQGKVDILEENLSNIEKEIKDKEDYSETLSKVKILFEQTAAYAREQSKKQIEDLVTKCLEFIFETDVEFLIELSTSRDIPVADFYVQNNYPEGYSVKANPELSSGGGVVDIISLALRIAFIQIHRPTLDGPIILDEPGKHVSDDYIFNLGEFLKKSSLLFNRQIIMVTHNPHLSQICDKSFNVTLKNGTSIVSTNTDDDDNLIS